MRNGIALALPQDIRLLLYGRPRGRAAAKPKGDEGRKVGSPPFAGSEIASAPTYSQATTVLILSEASSQEGNRSLLKTNGFAVTVLADTERLDALLSDGADICAFVVDRSYLERLDENQQQALFAKLASYSTFVWIRIDGSGLRIPRAELQNSIRNSRCQPGEVTFNELTIGQEGRLVASELDHARWAAANLEVVKRSQFVPGEITDAERAVLMAAAMRYARTKQIAAEVEVKSLETRFIYGGMTHARVAVLRINKEQIPVIAKISHKSYLTDEGHRFYRFIAPWDHKLLPVIHFHGPCGVILFGLIDDPSHPFVPAPTVSDQLHELWCEEVYGTLMRTNELATRLTTGILHAADRLVTLNKRRPEDGLGFEDYSSPRVERVLELAKRKHVSWGLPQSVFLSIETAANQFEKLNGSAIVHGDVHLGNILIRGNVESFLIDYAGSGPGHPAVDLVRLELSLFLRALKQTAEESECIEFQRMLSSENGGYDALSARFPRMVQSRFNEVCVQGCAAARSRAMEVLKVHGGNLKDYLATKLLVATQSLLIPNVQIGLNRSVILATAEQLSAL